MTRLSSPPDSRLIGGRIVSTKRGLCVVLKRVKERVALVPIIVSPENRHRADIHPSWVDACMMGLKSHDIIRCRPFVASHNTLHLTDNTLPSATMARVWKATRQEMHMQALESISQKQKINAL